MVRLTRTGANARDCPQVPVSHPPPGGLASSSCGRSPALSKPSPEEPESRDHVPLLSTGGAPKAAIFHFSPCQTLVQCSLSSQLCSCSRCPAAPRQARGACAWVRSCDGERMCPAGEQIVNKCYRERPLVGFDCIPSGLGRGKLFFFFF